MRGGQSGRLRAVSMSHALTWLMSAYLGIGVVLLHVGPLHRLIVDAMQEARMRRAMQPPHEPPPEEDDYLVYNYNRFQACRFGLDGEVVNPQTKQRSRLRDDIVRTLAELDAAVGKALAPIRQRARLLTTMPGVSDLTASVVVAEIGVDMSRFPTAGHLISWAGLCPRSDESAGKRRSTRVRKSGTWIKTTLVTAAWAAVRVKTSYLRAQFLRIKARRGAKKAILAVAASMLTAAFHMLRDGTEYNDLGSEHFDRQDKSKTIRRLLKRLQNLGCDVPELAHMV